MSENIRIKLLKKGLNVYHRIQFGKKVDTNFLNEILNDDIRIYEIMIKNIDESIELINRIEKKEIKIGDSNIEGFRNSQFFLLTNDEYLDLHALDLNGENHMFGYYEPIIYKRLMEITFINKNLPLIIIDDLISKYYIDVINILHFITIDEAKKLLFEEIKFIDLLYKVRKIIETKLRRYKLFEKHKEKIQLISNLESINNIVNNIPIFEN